MSSHKHVHVIGVSGPCGKSMHAHCGELLGNAGDINRGRCDDGWFWHQSCDPQVISSYVTKLHVFAQKA